MSVGLIRKGAKRMAKIRGDREDSPVSVIRVEAVVEGLCKAPDLVARRGGLAAYW